MAVCCSRDNFYPSRATLAKDMTPVCKKYEY